MTIRRSLLALGLAFAASSAFAATPPAPAAMAPAKSAPAKSAPAKTTAAKPAASKSTAHTTKHKCDERSALGKCKKWEDVKAAAPAKT